MIESLGRWTLVFCSETLAPIELFIQSIYWSILRAFQFRFRFRLCLQQAYLMAVQSTGVILFSVAFVSLMSVLEFSFHMKLILHQNSLVPSFSVLMMVRELAPVVTAMLLASRVGAGMAAELGSMKVTGQIDQLILYSVSPVEYLVVPRLFGCLFASLTLVILAIAVSVVTACIFGAPSLGYQWHEFFNRMWVFTHFSDIGGALVKAAVFGTLIPLVAAHQGLSSESGSRGVGNAATNAVVHATLLVILLDFVLTYLLNAL